jgi:hypothetical protein
MFQIEVVEKIRTHILYSITFSFRKSCRLLDNVEKYYRAEQVKDDRQYGACALHDGY